MVLTCTHNYALSKKEKKNENFFHLKIIIFTASKNCSIFHRCFTVMYFPGKVIPSRYMQAAESKVKTSLQSRIDKVCSRDTLVMNRDLTICA